MDAVCIGKFLRIFITGIIIGNASFSRIKIRTYSTTLIPLSYKRKAAVTIPSAYNINVEYNPYIGREYYVLYRVYRLSPTSIKARKLRAR